MKSYKTPVSMTSVAMDILNSIINEATRPPTPPPQPSSLNTFRTTHTSSVKKENVFALDPPPVPDTAVSVVKREDVFRSNTVPTATPRSTVQELIDLVFETSCRSNPPTSSYRILSSPHFYNLYNMEKAPDLNNSYFVQGLRNMHKYFDGEKGLNTQAPPPSPSTDIREAEKELEKIILTNEKSALRPVDSLPEPLTKKDRYGFFTTGSNEQDVLNNIRERRSALVGKDGQILGFDFPLLLAMYWMFERKTQKITCMTKEVDRIMSHTGFSKQAAARFMTYFPLQFYNKACHLLATHRRMRCFDVMYFINTGEVRYNGDLLVRLFWGDKYISNESALGHICLRYTENARQVLGTFLLQLGGVIATSFGRLRQIRSRGDDPYMPTIHDAKRVMECFLAPAYNTRQMGEQTTGFNTDYCDGFNLVSEVVKVSMGEMEMYIEQDREQNGASISAAREEKISAKDVLPFLPRIIATTLEEFYGYLYAACDDMPTVQDFSRTCLEHGNRFIPLFRRRYDLTTTSVVLENQEELETVLQLARITNVLARISTGEPVMGAEMRRSPISMAPFVKHSTWFVRPAVRYELIDLYARGRFPGSLPHRTYPMSDNGVSGEKENVPLVFFDGDEEEMQSDRYFWLQQDVKTFLAKNQSTLALTDDLSVPNQLMFRNNESAWLTEDYNLEQPPMPRLLLKGNLDEQANSSRQTGQSSTAPPLSQPQPMQDDLPPEWITIQNNLQPIEEENRLDRFHEDIVDSDHEWEYFDKQARAENPQPLAQVGDSMADLYREVLSWDVDPEYQQEPEHLFGAWFTNRYWLNRFFNNTHLGRFIWSDVTNAEEHVQYKDHMIASIYLTIRANIRRAIQSNDELDLFRNQPDEFMDDAYREVSIPAFLPVDVNQVVSAPGLFHMRATSTNLEHNKAIIDTLKGFTVCLAFMETPSSLPQSHPLEPTGRTGKRRKHSRIRRRRSFSNIVLMLIRKVQITGDNQEALGRETDPQTLRLTMTLSSKLFQNQRYVPQEGQIVHFLPICSMAAELRMFKAIHLLPTLPESFRNILHGSRQIRIEHDGLNVLTPVTRSTLTHAMVQAPSPSTNAEILSMVRRQVDRGSLDYLIRCLHRQDCQVDDSNFNALVQAMRTIGNGEPESSGAFCIQGPPGTGKTTNIVHLIGALLHHSLYGHVQRPSINWLDLNDNILRASDRNDAFKILVVASSNSAVDNVLDRISRYGIPDGRGRLLYPKMIRIARWDYEHLPHLQRYELRTASTRFDSNWEERNTPSLRARRRCAQEAIVFLTTASSAGGSGFKELEQHVDIVIHDEGANTAEPEVLVALTAATLRNTDRHRERPNRLFYVSVGDERQLPALSHVPEMIRESRLDGRLRFIPTSLSKSLFERLIEHNRVGHYFLGSQYRMHPTISRITSPPFYGVYFQNPLNRAYFNTEYNDRSLALQYPSGETSNPFHPMTFIDTSCIPERQEVVEAKGNIYNPLEARVIANLVDELLDMCHPGMLDNNIAVIAPYARQVQEIRRALHQECPALRLPRDRAEKNVRVCTVDSMQGSEASVVIFSATRSNKDRKTGFVKDNRRLNVSVSRAKYVNIILGDISTIDGTGLSSPDRGIEALKKIYDWCATEKEPGARLATVHPTRDPTPGNAFVLRYRPPRPSGGPSSSTRNRINTTTTTANLETIEATPNYRFANLFPPPDDDMEIVPQ